MNIIEIKKRKKEIEMEIKSINTSIHRDDYEMVFKRMSLHHERATLMHQEEEERERNKKQIKRDNHGIH